MALLSLSGNHRVKGQVAGVKEKQDMGEGFKSLTTWQKAYNFALDIYKAAKEFPKDETYALVSQIRRASVSVSANIAEGYERQHRKEYLQFLMIAKGSLGEVETYLMFARDLGYMDAANFESLENKRQELARLLRGLVKSLQQ